MTLQGITFQPEGKDQYFWFGREFDVCLESTDGFKWHIWLHAKDGRVVDVKDSTSKGVLVIQAKAAGWFKEGTA